MKAEDCKLSGAEVLKLTGTAESIKDLLLKQENGGLERPYRIKDILQAIINDQDFICNLDPVDFLRKFFYMNIIDGAEINQIFVTSDFHGYHGHNLEQVNKSIRHMAAQFIGFLIAGNFNSAELVNISIRPTITIIPAGFSVKDLANRFSAAIEVEGIKNLNTRKTKDCVALFFHTPYTRVEMRNRNENISKYCCGKKINFELPTAAELLCVLLGHYFYRVPVIQYQHGEMKIFEAQGYRRDYLTNSSLGENEKIGICVKPESILLKPIAWETYEESPLTPFGLPLFFKQPITF